MKLESKHIIPYLPWRLKCHNLIKNQTEISELKLSIESKNDCTISHLLEYDCYKTKPILRPLDDLSGVDKKYDTEYSINLLIGENDGYGNVTISYYQGDLNIDVKSSLYSSNASVDFKLIQTIQNLLFKNHYDVFGLIQNNLAIDINTLQPINK